jgi:3-phosphoshikimate 1-carboxyvinyltransferase
VDVPPKIIEPRKALNGLVSTPGDKSISHRALILSGMTEGNSTISGLSNGDDVTGTRIIMEQLGARFDARDLSRLKVHGAGSSLHPSESALDCGNSGTTLRLMMGLVASIMGVHEFAGDASLSRRPMDRAAIPLRMMGATVTGVGPQVTLPLSVEGGVLGGIDYTTPVASAQVKSAILLAGLHATENVIVREAVETRPHTEEMLLFAGADLTRERIDDHVVITLRPSSLISKDWVIPSDPSQGAFFVVAGLLAGSGSVTTTGLYSGITRTGFLGVLERMGGKLLRRVDSDGNLDVEALPSQLLATEVHAEEIPSLDEVPILAVAAAAASGVSRFIDVGELRLKESDRFEKSRELAEGLGARSWSEGNDLFIEGRGSSAFSRLMIDAGGDHRIAMASAIAGTVGEGAVISGFETVTSSYPDFLNDLASLS